MVFHARPIYPSFRECILRLVRWILEDKRGALRDSLDKTAINRGARITRIAIRMIVGDFEGA